MQVGISDPSRISSVQWLIDGLQVGEGRQTPFTFEWTPAFRGNSYADRHCDRYGWKSGAFKTAQICC